MIELRWPASVTEDLCAQVHRVLHAVVAAGGAVGYLTPPDRAVSDAWLSEVLAAVRSGDAALALGVVEAGSRRPAWVSADSWSRWATTATTTSGCTWS